MVSSPVVAVRVEMVPFSILYYQSTYKVYLYVFAAFDHSGNYISDITVMSYAAVCYRSIKILKPVVFSLARIYMIKLENKQFCLRTF
jgi:hypothetical protein